MGRGVLGIITELLFIIHWPFYWLQVFCHVLSHAVYSAARNIMSVFFFRIRTEASYSNFPHAVAVSGNVSLRLCEEHVSFARWGLSRLCVEHLTFAKLHFCSFRLSFALFFLRLPFSHHRRTIYNSTYPCASFPYTKSTSQCPSASGSEQCQHLQTSGITILLRQTESWHHCCALFMAGHKELWSALLRWVQVRDGFLLLLLALPLPLYPWPCPAMIVLIFASFRWSMFTGNGVRQFFVVTLQIWPTLLRMRLSVRSSWSHACLCVRMRERGRRKKFLHLDCNVCVSVRVCAPTVSIPMCSLPHAPASLPPDEWRWGRKNSIFLLGITNLFPISVKFFLILRTENPGDINNLHFLPLPGTICLRSDGRFWSTPSTVCVCV